MDMPGEKKMEQSETVAAGLKSDVYTPIIEEEGAAGEKGMKSDTTSFLSYSEDVMPTVNGYIRNSSPLDAGYFSGSRSLQGFDSYGSGTMPNESWNSPYVSDATNSTTDVFRREKSALGSNVTGKTKGISNSVITNNNFDSRPSNFPLNSNSQRYAASPNMSKSHAHTQRLKPSNQFSPGYRSAGQFQPLGKFSSYTANNQRSYCAHDAGFNDRPNARMWNGNDGYNQKEKSNINGELEATAELTRGPRGQGSNKVSTPVEDNRMGLSLRRDQYNLEDFQTTYDNAKFYVIKSYSEDDIHKCIKYDVWSSTPNGNRKLDAAFQDTQAKTSEAGIECPIFLFYSVNGSGQFVGLAEMIGPMDFAKNMNFWQRDKWNGFFPVKWHMVKDIPNTQLRHIIIESNDNKPVTHSRDTQEIGLQQGLKMLKIFKSYSGVTSMLDDFNFYENREQSLREKRNNMRAPQKEMFTHHDFPKHQRAGERTNRGRFTTNNYPDPTLSVIRQTKKLSINN
ncbi:YTH domain-containing protein [Heracleum sosnowskyi]|uniref:YTH domain-containing family protein n=1 Tax=Heracleum sosnowskyi TaxID=360622 RepID=A0AAD8JG20_9APIA|nr:YTH domain-containing protein [Heracleum sosnowskyi]